MLTRRTFLASSINGSFLFLLLSNFPLVRALQPGMPMHQLLLRTLTAAGMPLSEYYWNLPAAHDVKSSSLGNGMTIGTLITVILFTLLDCEAVQETDF